MRLARALLASDCSQLKVENSPTPRDRAEPLTRTASASADPSATLLLSHHRPPFLHLAPAGLAVLAVFLVFLQGGGSFWLFAFPPPPAACSARPAGVALSISHLHSAPKKHNGGTVQLWHRLL